ncbi:uncharacterized protein LOC122279511 [Carya illinoinensis]|uniref:uncharacterized protein LOC122279511 n=1 Tax=Carya illinoinensis TaxID=32201 RepID=UPI001C71A50C|nr:uncharacterized protein LOC122279511 [Carya illinoinensis]
MQDGRAEESYSEPENEIAEHLSKNKQYPSESDEIKEKTQGKDENRLDMLKNRLKFEYSFSNQCAVVYARCSYLERRELWRSLQLDAVQDTPWLCLGDFNIIRREEERRGGRPRLRIVMDDFNEFIDTCGLLEMKLVGMVFANGGRASLQTISDIFALYESWSGQVVSKEKSSIFFPKYVNSARKRNLLQLTSFSECLFPVKYLGVPLFSGRVNVSYFEDLLNRIRDRLEGWQNRLLSAGARLLLLHHVVSSILVHLLSVVHAPKKVVSSLNRIMSNFFWGTSNGKQKRKWVAWQKVCMLTKEGGLGLRKFEEVQSSLFMKLASNLLSRVSLWANFFRKKYCKGEHVTLVDNTKRSPLWKCIMTMVPNIINNAWWRIKE